MNEMNDEVPPHRLPRNLPLCRVRNRRWGPGCAAPFSTPQHLNAWHSSSHRSRVGRPIHLWLRQRHTPQERLQRLLTLPERRSHPSSYDENRADRLAQSRLADVLPCVRDKGRRETLGSVVLLLVCCEGADEVGTGGSGRDDVASVVLGGRVGRVGSRERTEALQLRLERLCAEGMRERISLLFATLRRTKLQLTNPFLEQGHTAFPFAALFVSCCPSSNHGCGELSGRNDVDWRSEKASRRGRRVGVVRRIAGENGGGEARKRVSEGYFDHPSEQPNSAQDENGLRGRRRGKGGEERGRVNAPGTKLPKLHSS